MVVFQSGCLFNEVIFNHVVGNNWPVKHIPFQKKHKKLPVVLSKAETNLCFSVIQNPKYHAIAGALYGAGLRLFECLNLKTRDIDSNKMVTTVRNGKGNKDRQTVLGEKLLVTMRNYFKSAFVKPVSYLFPRKDDLHKPFSRRHTQRFIR